MVLWVFTLYRISKFWYFRGLAIWEVKGWYIRLETYFCCTKTLLCTWKKGDYFSRHGKMKIVKWMSIKQRVGVHSLTGKIFLLEVQYGIAYNSSHRNPGGMKVMYHTLLFVAAAITGPLLVSSISRSIIGSEHSECNQYTAPRSKVNRSIIWSTWYMYKVPVTKYHFTLLNLH